MEQNISKVLFVLAWVVIAVGIISNLDMTIHLNATQYVAEGEKPDPIRIPDILSDVVRPLFDGFVLIALSYIIKFIRKPKASE